MMDERSGRFGSLAMNLGLRAVAGGVKVHGGSFLCEEGKSSTIYYSTKVRFCDKVAENLILECRDLGAGRLDFGG